jgi:hypothetical protein
MGVKIETKKNIKEWNWKKINQKRIKGKIKRNRNNEDWNKKTNWIKYEGHNWKKNQNNYQLKK